MLEIKIPVRRSKLSIAWKKIWELILDGFALFVGFGLGCLIGIVFATISTCLFHPPNEILLCIIVSCGIIADIVFIIDTLIAEEKLKISFEPECKQL